MSTALESGKQILKAYTDNGLFYHVLMNSSRGKKLPAGSTAWIAIALFGLVDASCFQVLWIVHDFRVYELGQLAFLSYLECTV
jgi:hypothetical protein